LLKVVEALVEEVEYSLDEERFSVARLIHLALAGLEDVAFHFFHPFKAGLKKTSPVGFLGFLGFLGVFGFFLYICPEERVFMFFSVSRTLLGASRL
jgi:hypothetical protein